MTSPWRLLSERPGTAGYLAITTRRYELPDGSTAEWDIYGGARTVAVLAVTPQQDVVLARQFRPGPGVVLDELPGGGVEDDEEVALAAGRELLEETGYAGRIEIVGRTWLSSASRTEQFVAVAHDAKPVAAPANQDGEFCEVVLLPLARLRDHLRAGQLTDVDLGYLALDYLGLLT